MTTLKKYDAIVVGCGAMGSSISYNLAKRGARTLTLERFSLNHTEGSSHGRSRIIRTAYAENSLYVPLAQRARELWFEIQSLAGKELIRMTGGLSIGHPEGELISGVVKSAREHGLEHELLGPTEIKERFPVFAPSEEQVGFFEKDAGILFPERCIQAYYDLAKENGRSFGSKNRSKVGESIKAEK